MMVIITYRLVPRTHELLYVGKRVLALNGAFILTIPYPIHTNIEGISWKRRPKEFRSHPRVGRMV